MKINDLFLKVRDYIEGDLILDELINFMGDEELGEFCDYLQEKYDIDMSGDMDDYYDNDSYNY